MNDKESLKGMIDRFEGEWAVIDIASDPNPRNVLRKLLPRRAKEGDSLQLKFKNGNVILAKVDPDSTQAASKRIQEKLTRLRRGEHHRDD